MGKCKAIFNDPCSPGMIIFMTGLSGSVCSADLSSSGAVQFQVLNNIVKSLPDISGNDLSLVSSFFDNM